MNILQAQLEIQRLWGLYQAGALSPEAYTQAVNQLLITDESGGFWHVDGATQKWYHYTDQAWVEEAPPAAAAPAPPPPAAAAPWPPAPPPPPDDAAPLSPRRPRLPLWIGLGVALVALAAVVILALSGVFSGGSKAATQPTQTQAAAATTLPAAATTLPATAAPSATQAPPATKTPTAQPPNVTKQATALPPKASPTVTKTPLKPTSTPPDPAVYLNAGGPWLLSRDLDNIFLIQAKRTDQINPERVVGPSSLADMVAPSGGRLAFITTADPDGLRGLHLNIYNLAQRQVEKVIPLTSATTDPAPGAMPGENSVEAVRSITDVTSIAWSPDGRTLAFIGVPDGPSSDLYTWSLDSDKITRLTDGPSQAYGPAWSPDGKFILQFGVTTFGTGAGYSMAGAWAARADNSGVISLYAPVSQGEHTLGWLDNNTFLVYGFNMVCGSYALRAVSIQPLQVTTLLPGCFTRVAFEPVKHTLALAIDRYTAEGPGQMQNGLYLRKADGTWQLLAAGDATMAALPTNSGVVWASIDGQAVAFTTAGAAIPLPADAPQSLPQAAPDGKTWAITNGYNDKIFGLWVGPVSGGARQVFTDGISAAAWTPAGSGAVLAFMSDTTLYFASAPGYQPVLYGDIFAANELTWARP